MDPSIVQFMASQGLAIPPQSGMVQFQGSMPPGPGIMNSVTSLTPSGAKRRKLGNGQMMDEVDLDDEGKAGSSKLTLEAKRSQHCEVEKKRRERMNRYMSELAQMIPACNAVPRKLDKLSILKMAVDHMKNLQGDCQTPSEYKPGFLTDDELKKLIVEAANGFMMIVECSQAKILYVSDTIDDVLQEKPDNWVGSCLYDMLHHKDIVKVRDQLACFDVDSVLKESSTASNSPLVMHGQSINGLRRSFLCRVKKTKEGHPSTSRDSSRSDYNNSETFIKLLHPHENSQYAVLHCTGFIRNLTSSERRSLRVEDSSAGTCLVAVARLQHFGDDGPKVSMETSENEFVTRVAVDGRFSYVDPRVASVLGYLPQDLIGQVSYEYYHPDDIEKMVHLHHDAMKRRTPMPTVRYRFLCKDHKWLSLAMKAFAFVNPFSQQVEYVVCTNVIMRAESKETETSSEMRGAMMALRPPGGELGGANGDSQVPMDQGMLSDPLSMLLMSSSTPPAGPSSGDLALSFNTSSPSDMAQPTTIVSAEMPGAAISTPAAVTIQENAATAQHILDEYNRMHTTPMVRKDLNISFPPGLFTNEVNLMGSEFPYRHLLQELENPAEFTELFKQVPANPLKLPNAFQDLDLFD
ncbi:protein cycle-like [Halichondria panicea]|uniref:protein cycle-like n=1 Tax=Halichondria panicea TaxID=6063 RepID=UPI00312B6CA2